jgi:hypothetical protein
MVLVTGTVIAYQFSRRGRFPQSSPVLLFIGCLWVFYTIAFEYLFFSFPRGCSVEQDHSKLRRQDRASVSHRTGRQRFFVTLVGRLILRARSTPSG